MPPAQPSDPIFAAAVERLLLHEGGYVDHPSDPGGATAYGVSLRWLRSQGEDIDGDGDVDVADIKALSRADAIRLYREHWWDRHGYARLGLVIGQRVFGFAVNMGAPAAHRILQRACRACGEQIADDGALGPVTVHAAGMAGEARLLPALRSEAAGHYRWLVARNPKLEVFLRGWLARAYS